MKRIIICLWMCFIPFMLFAQEKKEMQLELKNGTSLSGMVQIQPDGSFLLETDSGDVFFFNSSEVKKATPVAKPVNLPGSDENYQWEIVYKKGGKLRFSQTGEFLSQKDFSTYEGWQNYQKARSSIKTANILLITTGGIVAVGGATAIVGAILDVSELDKEMEFNGDEIASVGGIIGLAAVIPAITSLIFGIVGNTQLKKMADTYNQHPGYVLDFGAQQYGVGFALKF